MKKLIIVALYLLFTSSSSFCQGVNDIETKYTSEHFFSVQDLYKWRNQMNFKPRYFNDTNKFDNIILGMSWEACRQWYIEIAVTWENFKKEGESGSDWFVFKKKLDEYYGPIPQKYIEKWFIPLYCFLNLDKWAYKKSGGNGL